MEIESMKSGAAASYQEVQQRHPQKRRILRYSREASTQAGLSQTADKKPAVQNFFYRKGIRRIRIRSEEKDAKQGTQLKKSGQ